MLADDAPKRSTVTGVHRACAATGNAPDNPAAALGDLRAAKERHASWLTAHVRGYRGGVDARR